MILKSAKVENFKCIEDSNEFKIGPVTCLVGKNESGKSALLQSLHKLNPDNEGAGGFSLVEEYPRTNLNSYEEAQSKNPGQQLANVLTTAWDLSEADREALSGELGPSVLELKSVTLTKGYDNQRRWQLNIDEEKIVAYLVESAGLYEEEVNVLGRLTTVRELISELQAAQNPSPRQADFLESLQSSFPGGTAYEAAVQILESRLPMFVYFSSYEKMPGQVAIDALLLKRRQGTVSFGERVFLAFLGLTGTTPEEIQSIPKFEPFIAKLEGVSNRISKEIFEYWSQNKHLEVEFRYDAARLADPAPFNTGYVFRTRIRNRRHGVTVSFDERSSGFVWFFSFLVWFSQVRRNYGENLIILLDEPGLSLHAKAQQDLLRYMNEKLKPYYQVIYSTHSPFMIDPENLLSARTVEDTVVDGAILGTKVGDDVLSTDADTISPLQAALGYEITQSMFVGKHTLIVEGSSDLLYLKWVSHELQSRGRAFLDQRWTIAPVGGVDKVASFVALFGANKLHIAVFTDLQKGQKKKTRDLRELGLLKEGHVFSAEMFLENRDEADIEDMLGRDLYVSLVNQCYSLDTAHTIPVQKPADAETRVVKEVESHFSTLPPEVQEFDHMTPAVFLMEHTGELRSNLPHLDQALDRFEKLFTYLNRLLPE